jgi:hypothetical protein
MGSRNLFRNVLSDVSGRRLQVGVELEQFDAGMDSAN